MHKLRRLVDRLFPERQLFLRAEDHVRYLRLSQGVQVGLFGVACVGALWVLYASSMYLVHNRYLAAKDAEIGRQQAATLALSGQIAGYRNQVAKLDSRVEEQRSELVAAAAAAVARESSVQEMVAAAQAESRRQMEKAAARGQELDAAGSRLEIASAARLQAENSVQVLRTEHQAAQDRLRLESENAAALESRLETASVERLRAVHELQVLRDEHAAAQEQLRLETQMVAGLRKDLDAAASRLEVVSAERLRAVNEAQALRDQDELAREQVRRETEKAAALRSDLDAATQRLETVLTARQQDAEARQVPWDRFEAVRDQLRREKLETARLRGDLDATGSRLQAALSERRQAVIAHRALRDESDAVQGRLRQELQTQQATRWGRIRRESENTALLRDDFETVTARLEAVHGEKAKVVQDRDRWRSRVNQLERELSDTVAAQQQVLARIAQRTAGRIDRFERLVDYTGVDDDALLIAAGITPTGRGGAFIAADGVDGAEDDLDSVVATLDSYLDRWQGLEHLLKRLPLAAPVTSYYVSSQYGLRRDPYSKKRSMHRGVDLAGVLRSPVFAPAPGVVVKAGRDGPNGKMVEIDHGMNIRTRYAHLTKILVKKGQKVEFHDKIALTGSSGRSTGPHLHYEIWVDGRSYDPMRFVNAGRYAVQDIPAFDPAKLLHPVKPKPEPPEKG